MVEAIRGRYVLIGDNKGSVIEDGAVVFDGGTILDVGVFSKMEQIHHPKKIYGSPDHVVLPGLVNSHQHGYGIDLVRVGVTDGPLEPWIINSYYHPDGRSVPIFYENTLLAGLKMLKSGVTTTVHHYYGSEAHRENYLEMIDICLQAYRDLGMRVAFAPVIRDMHQFAYMDDDAFISRLPTYAVDSLRKLGKIPVQYPTAAQYFGAFDKLRSQYEDDKTRLLYGPAGPQWCSTQLLEEMNERSKQGNIGIHMHVLESPVQRKYGNREYPGGLIGYLEGLGLLDKRLSLAHAVQLTREEIRKLAIAGCQVSHNPSSNLRLFNGVAPVRDMLEEGLSVGIGTDNSCPDEDMLREMTLCSLLHRPPRIDTSPIPSSVILNMNVANGAKITQFEGVIGSIEAGKKADLILLDFAKIERPFISPDADVLTVILTLATKSNVDTVFVDGNPIVEQGKSTQVDEDKLLQDIRQKYQLRGDNPEAKRLRQAITDELIRLYSSW